MKRFRLIIGAKSYDVQVDDGRQSPMTVIVDGEAFRVEVEAAEEGEVLQASQEESFIPGLVRPREHGPAHVTAPMPGTILDIKVRVGDPVKRGQILCALEAMKMKSPIRAVRAGTVRQIQVSEGQTVEHGDLLIVVE